MQSHVISCREATLCSICFQLSKQMNLPLKPSLWLASNLICVFITYHWSVDLFLDLMIVGLQLLLHIKKPENSGKCPLAVFRMSFWQILSLKVKLTNGTQQKYGCLFINQRGFGFFFFLPFNVCFHKGRPGCLVMADTRVALHCALSCHEANVKLLSRSHKVMCQCCVVLFCCPGCTVVLTLDETRIRAIQKYTPAVWAALCNQLKSAPMRSSYKIDRQCLHDDIFICCVFMYSHAFAFMIKCTAGIAVVRPRPRFADRHSPHIVPSISSVGLQNPFSIGARCSKEVFGCLCSGTHITG